MASNATLQKQTDFFSRTLSDSVANLWVLHWTNRDSCLLLNPNSRYDSWKLPAINGHPPLTSQLPDGRCRKKKCTTAPPAALGEVHLFPDITKWDTGSCGRQPFMWRGIKAEAPVLQTQSQWRVESLKQPGHAERKRWGFALRPRPSLPEDVAKVSQYCPAGAAPRWRTAEKC